MKDRRPSGGREEFQRARRDDQTGRECSRSKRHATRGNAGAGQRRRHNARSPLRPSRGRPHETRPRRPRRTRREPMPRGPRSIRGRVPLARARTCPLFARNPRTPGRVKPGEPSDERKPCVCCRIATRAIRRPFSSLEAEDGRTFARGTMESNPGSRRWTPDPGMSAFGVIGRWPCRRDGSPNGSERAFRRKSAPSTRSRGR